MWASAIENPKLPHNSFAFHNQFGRKPAPWIIPTFAFLCPPTFRQLNMLAFRLGIGGNVFKKALCSLGVDRPAPQRSPFWAAMMLVYSTAPSCCKPIEYRALGLGGDNTEFVRRRIVSPSCTFRKGDSTLSVKEASSIGSIQWFHNTSIPYPFSFSYGG